MEKDIIIPGNVFPIIDREDGLIEGGNHGISGDAIGITPALKGIPPYGIRSG